MTLSKSPKAIRPNAQILMNQAQAREIAASIRPKITAFLGGIRPEGIGRFLVRSIIASMSRSLYPVSVSAAAEPSATPASKSVHVNRVILMSNRNEAESAAPNAVKTSRYQILGFVSSKQLLTL